MIPMQRALRGRGLGHHRNTGHYNRNYGRDQNLNYGGDQNLIYGGDQHIYNGGPIGRGIWNTAGRDFVHNFYTVIANPNKSVWDIIVGLGASHKAEQQHERGSCLHGTREEVIKIILDWIASQGPDRHICWLSGAAGVGKSAIAMTIAQICERQRVLVTSFFFFRSDPNRNNPSALWFTVAHGLALTMPVLKGVIEEKIMTDPTIPEATLEHQFHELILDPAPTWDWQGGLWGFINDLVPVAAPRVVIIDGLDECGDEPTQLRILSILQNAFQHVPHFPLRFLVCSRPEAWLREAFAEDALRQLSRFVVLDDKFMPDRDIIRYYLHHFQEITTSQKYSQVRFPTPWPSRRDLEALVERTNGQFAYAATVIRFLQAMYRHPIEQLRIILENVPPRRVGESPYRQLDALYEVIISANTEHEDVLLILSAIIVLPLRHSQLVTPSIIELVLGLPSGQVPLTLRAMYSVLDIRGPHDPIHFFHTSFRDYLLDQSRSHQFYIDIPIQRHAIARMWLQNLSTQRIHCYSSSQLWNQGNEGFFVRWVRLCKSTHEPTRDLLDDLRNIDQAMAIAIMGYLNWVDFCEPLVGWVRKYCLNPMISENRELTETGARREAGENSFFEANSYYGQCDIAVPGRETDNRADDLDLVEHLVHKFQDRPQCFHLEWPLGVPPSDDVVRWIVRRVTSKALISGSRPSGVDNVRLTDCHCDLSGGNGSHDPWHVAYQEACLKSVKVDVCCFEELSQRVINMLIIDQLGHIALNLIDSTLLEHCRLDMELLSLCWKFFGLAKACLILRFDSVSAKRARENMLKWFETFPDRFAAWREPLKAQFLGLPWEQWRRNYEMRHGAWG